MTFSPSGVSQISLHGYSSLSPEEILSQIKNGTDVARMPGDFVMAAEEGHDGQRRVIIATSAVSALPHFYYISPDRNNFEHGSNVFECARRAGLDWKWNDRAVVSLALLQHTLDSDTLHPDILRIPAGSILEFRPGKFEIRSSNYLRSGEERFDVLRAVQCVNQVTSELIAGEKVAISLSAGYDSRLLLSSVLREGHTPLVATMGSLGSTDVRVATAIAKTFSLQHNVVELSAGDYFRHARKIVRLTGGTKTADHWHTYLFIHNAGFPPDAVHLAGANGELVRTYFFDKGILARLSEKAPAHCAAFFLRLKNRAQKRIPLRRAAGVLADPSFIRNAFRQMCDSSSHGDGWLDALDEFYTWQRVRHFIGNGLALYNAVIPTRSPFLDVRFLSIARNMPRRLKLCNRFHRHAIAVNEPRLLEFPVDDGNVAMANEAIPFYWLRTAPVTGYSVFAEAADSKEGRAIIIESKHLDRFLDRRSRESVARNQMRSLAGLLISLHFTVEEINHLLH